MIQLQLIGHLGADATTNEVNGKTVINFSVAHSEKWRDSQGNEKERTTWVSCSYWVQSANISQYLKKGTQVYVEGIPDVKIVTLRDSQQVPSLQLRVNTIQLLGGKRD